MQSEEIMKKLADNFGTLVMVNKRHPSSMSRLKKFVDIRRGIRNICTKKNCRFGDRGRLLSEGGIRKP